METKQLPKNYKNLPVIHIYGSHGFSASNRRFIVAGIFFLVLCIYYFGLFETLNIESTPTSIVKWGTLHYFGLEFGWYTVWLLANWLPWLAACIGFLMFIFSPQANKRTGMLFGIIGFASLELWHYYEYGRNDSWHEKILGGTFQYWLLLTMFAIVTALCWERRRKKEVKLDSL